jgi:hypothetical protein
MFAANGAVIPQPCAPSESVRRTKHSISFAKVSIDEIRMAKPPLFYHLGRISIVLREGIQIIFIRSAGRQISFEKAFAAATFFTNPVLTFLSTSSRAPVQTHEDHMQRR